MRRHRVLGSVAVVTVGVFGLSPAYGELLSGLGSSLGSAGATTGNNVSAGNGANNTAGGGGGGGLLGLNLGLGGPTAQSNGDSQINSGAAGATGNSSGGSGGGLVPLPAGSSAPIGFTAAGAPVSADAAKSPTGFVSSSGSSSGFANADTGNNRSAGNAGNNTAGGGTVAGGLLGINIGLGGPTAISNGTSEINSGAAGATGIGSGPSPAAAALGASGGCGLGPAAAALNSVGSASANTGGNRSAGNAGNNTASSPSVTGGLLGLNLTLGGPTAVSNGTSDINTGAAGAEGIRNAAPACVAPIFVSNPPVFSSPHSAPAIKPVSTNGPALAVTGVNPGLGLGGLLVMGVGGALVAATRRRRGLTSALGIAGGPSLAGTDWDAVVTR